MLAAVKGYYAGIQIVMDENIDLEAGQEVIVTFLTYRKKQGKRLTWKSIQTGGKAVSHRCTGICKGVKGRW